MTSILFSDTADDCHAFGVNLCQFITDSPTAFHAAFLAEEELGKLGFRILLENEAWHSITQSGGYCVRRGGAFIAWHIPHETPEAIRIIGTHTDSPAFKVKPSVTSPAGKHHCHVDVEVYGGMIVNSWLNRELGLAGLLVDKDGNEHLVNTVEPMMVIPQLAIHLDRTQNDSLQLSRQQHMHPLVADKIVDADVMSTLAHSAGINKNDIAGMEIYSYDAQGPRRFGAGKTLLASGRQDNLLSVYSALCAMATMVSTFPSANAMRGETTHTTSTNEVKHTQQEGQAIPASTGSSIPTITMIIGFDHEEVGSQTRYGAAGPFLDSILMRLRTAFGWNDDDYQRLLSRSSCLSTDVVHAVNPNYQDKHDPSMHPFLGGGPAVKVNANQRYSTDAYGLHLWNRACQRANITSQHFVSHNDVTCGSTIAPMVATRYGITTIDAGAPLWSMHSAREISQISDSLLMSRLMKAYLIS
ncbi:MAG: M18 family aminopeptidase [Actinomycetaceae bacterium]|nr:M18 family aminopeptidase [Actinomycetaceae bacterium]